MQYTKSAFSFTKLVSLLESKGLTVSNKSRCRKYLKNNTYYRLSAYFYPFYQPGTKNFRTGTTFEDILNLYQFDKKLRKCVFNAIETVEISIRSRLVHHYAIKYGPHWHLKHHLYRNYDDYVGKLTTYSKAEKKGKNEVFIQHYRGKYTDPQVPPAWVTMELLTFGELSKTYQFLKSSKTKQEIARGYGLKDIVLESWLHYVNYLRNNCAHHARVWNRVFRINPKTPRSSSLLLPNGPAIKKDRLFWGLSCLQYLYRQIEDDNAFKSELQRIINQHSPDLNRMNFPSNWTTHPTWQ